jgi:hypothetical protein
VAAFKDSRQAYITMVEKYSIPKEQWVEEFKENV